MLILVLVEEILSLNTFRESISSLLEKLVMSDGRRNNGRDPASQANLEPGYTDAAARGLMYYRRRKKTFICEICKKEFLAVNTHAKVCGNACRIKKCRRNNDK